MAGVCEFDVIGKTRDAIAVAICNIARGEYNGPAVRT